MDLLYLLYSLLRKKWIIVGCTILGLAAGFVFTLFQKKTYASAAQYSTGFTMAQKVSIKEEVGVNIYEIDLRFNNVIETFKSPKVLGMLSYKLLLHDLEDLKPFRVLDEEKKKKDEFRLVNIENAKQILRRKVAGMELISPFDPEEKKVFDLMYLYGYAPEYLAGKLTIYRAERTDYLVIYAKSENPELSAFLANNIGQQFIRFFNSIYGLRDQESTAKLDSLTSSKKRAVDSLTEGLKDFRTKIGTPNVADRASAAMSVVQGLTTNYQQELAKLNNLQGELRAVESQLRDMSTGGQANTTYTNNNGSILALQRENQDFELQKIGKSDEEIKKLQDQIDANVKKIAQFNNAGGTTLSDRQRNRDRSQTRQEDLVSRKIELEQQIVAAQGNVTLFGKQKDYYESITKTGGGEQVILDAQERDLRIASQEYEKFKQSLQASLDLDVNPQNNFKQILVAQPAYMAEPSRRSMVLGLCGMLMFFFSAFIIVALEFFDSSYKTPSIFQRTVKLKLLSSLNRIDLKKKQLNEYFIAGESGREGQGALFIENLRKLRYELTNTGKKIFLVTSTKPKEGKTTVIEALANSLSLTKKKVLLIDANFSNNTLTQKFEAKPTLEQFNGNNNTGDKFWNITSMTAIPNTDLVGCAEGNYTPSEVLPKNNLLQNLPKIAENYDFVFVEGAALNNHADSKELAAYVDGIIAVFSAKSSLGQVDKDSIQYLKDTGDKFVGTVLNFVEENNMEL